MKFFFFAAIAFAMASCSGKKCECQGENGDNAPAAASNECRIAYIEIDSLMSQYQFAKDFTMVLTKKMDNIQNTLSKKERDLQQQAQAMQKKYENGGFSSAQELQNAQQNLANAQQNLQALGERLSADFAEEQAKYNNDLRDSIQSFIIEFNKNKKYDYIMTRAGDNMLYANPHLDITRQVIKGLNDRYKPSDELKEKLGK